MKNISVRICLFICLFLTVPVANAQFWKKKKKNETQQAGDKPVPLAKDTGINKKTLAEMAVPAKTVNTKTSINYKQAFAVIDSLMKLDQPVSASERVLKVKEIARKDNQVGYFIQALRYELMLTGKLKEGTDRELYRWQLLNREMVFANEAVRVYIYLDMAAELKQVFIQNRWNSGRIADDSSKNPLDWSLGRLHAETRHYITQSIGLSKGYAIEPYLEPIIDHVKKHDLALNLQQVIALSAIEILSGMNVEAPVTYISPSVTDAMADADVFAKKDFSVLEDPKNEYMILSLYQVLLSDYHLYFDLQRLGYVREHYPGSGETFAKACQKILEKHATDSFSNLAAVELAQYYQENEPLKAIAYIREAIRRHPYFSQNARLHNLESTIMAPVLDAELEEVNQPGKKILARVQYKNITKLYITAYTINYGDYITKFRQYYYGDNDARKKAAFIVNQKEIGRTYSISIPDFGDYKNHSAEIPVEALPEGMHLLVISDKENITDSLAVVSYATVCVSKYAILREDQKIRLISAENGEGQAGKPYKIFEKGNYWDENAKYKLVKSGISGKGGVIEVPEPKAWSASYVLEVEEHVLYDQDFHKNYNFTNPKDQVQAEILTDRAIYRPGQKVYFKAIAYMNQAKHVVKGRELTVILRDNNSEEKGRMTVKTNQYGSASGSFILPKGGFNTGNFRIEISGLNSAYFKVEEYKVPKYTVRIPEPTRAYKLNDQVIMTGEAMALAGYAIQDAKVEYTVKRRIKPRYWDYYWYRGFMPTQSQEQTIKTGQTKTGADGKFPIEFDAIPDLKVDTAENPYFIFEIEATVTDINGEVRSASYSMTLSYTDIEVSLSGHQDYIEGEKIELAFSSKNLQGKNLPFTGNIVVTKIIRKDMTGDIKRQRLWSKTDTSLVNPADFPGYDLWGANEAGVYLGAGSFVRDSSGKWIVPKTIDLNPGAYTATMSTKDGGGKTVNASFRFYIHPSGSGRFREPQALKVAILNGKSFEPGQTAKVIISGAAIHALARVHVSSKAGLILDKEIIVAENSQVVDVPVKAADRGNIVVSVSMIYNYSNYQEQKTILVPYSNKELQIKLSSFRSDMEPGSREKWMMTLKGPASEKAAMEVAAVMYDQSLDELYPNSGWQMNLYPDYYHNGQLQHNLGSRHFQGLKVFEPALRSFPGIIHPELNGRYMWDFGDIRFKNVRGGYYSSGNDMMLEKAQVGNSYFSLEARADADSAGDVKERGKKDKEEEKSDNDAQNGQPAIRKNFNETAFFFPQLYANEKGEISIEFTMPESLTRWKMMMLAHSATMQMGYSEQSVTTSKKVMLQPNMPRFLREGDRISIVSKLVNTTKEVIQATISIRIKDEETGKELAWVNGQDSKSVTVPAGANSASGFTLDIPDYKGVVSIAIYVVAGNYSDGEQRTLLVLSKRNLVTETMPLTIRKQGELKLEFSSLKNNTSTTLRHEKLSVEMSSNPAWYAVQALPYMMEYPHECAEQIFTRLYANSIATHIANSDPAIRKTYEAWERASASGSGLQSKLMQNQDLKSVMIEETPWMAEAKNETERMKKLGLLFNRKRMDDEIQTAFEKLRGMQMDNGAWGWFKGMYPNSYITQTIVIGFGKMQKMGVNISPYKSMIEKAIAFLDKEAAKDYAYYQSLREPAQFYPSNLQYLYCKSFFPATGLKDTSRIIRYFIDNAEKTWTQNALISRAQLAVTLHILDPQSKVPQLIVKSFTENSKQTDEMGMYWPANTRGWYWYEAPVETHVAIMEAYKALEGNEPAVREQEIWLLRQKQTQGWGTTRSTADACYALLTGGHRLNSGQDIMVSLGQVPVVPERTEAGTGYFRKDIPVKDISAKSADISITATTSDFAYGVVYWQYFEDMDKIKTAGAGLSITKRLYKIVHTASGDQKIELKVGDVLQVGDLVEVSLAVSCDRNLEFVHVKDQRASGTEPTDVLSEYHWKGGLGYYQSTKDASTNFFIDNLPKGNYQLNYTLKVEQAGVFSSGMATAQCMYAPEFSANSSAVILKVE